ncbi:hypothetical protein [Paraburkholderia fungorum]|uniref:hypothetical protein n=1 Tax=Paraburkholderia fungorum TaxID=134537 RepID=UPI003D6496D5
MHLAAPPSSLFDFTETSVRLPRNPHGKDCWGTENIMSAANGGRAYRRLEDWVMIDQNTHITQTVRQLARIKAAGRIPA